MNKAYTYLIFGVIFCLLSGELVFSITRAERKAARVERRERAIRSDIQRRTREYIRLFQRFIVTSGDATTAFQTFLDIGLYGENSFIAFQEAIRFIVANYGVQLVQEERR